MADQLPVATAGGAVTVPGAAGGAVVDHVGDVTGGRGDAAAMARSGATAGVAGAAVVQQLEQRMRLTPQQLSEWRAFVAQHKQAFEATIEEKLLERWTQERDADDSRDHEAFSTTMRARWGDAYDSNIEKIVAMFRSLPPAVMEALYSARTDDGTLLANTPAGIEWLLQLTTQGRGPSPGERERRIAEIEGFLRAPRGSEEYRRYYDDPKVQAEYYDLLNHRST